MEPVTMYKIVTLSSKGQITIPKAMAEQLGIYPGNKVTLSTQGTHLSVRPYRSIVEELAGSLAAHVKCSRKAIEAAA